MLAKQIPTTTSRTFLHPARVQSLTLGVRYTRSFFSGPWITVPPPPPLHCSLQKQMWSFVNHVIWEFLLLKGSQKDWVYMGDNKLLYGLRFAQHRANSTMQTDKHCNRHPKIQRVNTLKQVRLGTGLTHISGPHLLSSAPVETLSTTTTDYTSHLMCG